MKYLLIAFLIGLAALEFFHHLHNGPAPEAITGAEPQHQRGGESLRHHLHSHR
jgi:hypothetical protein